MKIKSVTTKILLAAISATLPLALGLMLSMTYFMGNLTDSVMLGLLQPMAKTAAQNVENRLHIMADRFFIMREHRMMRDPNVSVQYKQMSLDIASAGREYAWLGLYEPDGSLLTGSDDSPRNISGRELFPLLLETGSLVVERTGIGPMGPEIVMGIPIIDINDPQNRQVAYYLVGSYRYEVLGDALRDINIGTKGTAFVVDENGAFVAHKELGRVISQQSARSSLGTGPAAEEVMRALLGRQTGASRLQSPEGDFFVGYAPIKGALWSLCIQTPRAEFLAPAKKALLTGAVITLAVLLSAVVLLGFFNRRILSLPLRAITGSAHQLARGNFEGNLPAPLLARRDEIGQLGAAFESMSASVRGVLHDIAQLTRANRAGNLEARVRAGVYYGDFQRIAASINTSLDGVCAYLDGMPDAMLLLNEKRQHMYNNKAMAGIMDRHGLSAETRDLFARLLPEAGASASSRVDDIFRPGPPAVYELELTLPDRKGDAYNYIANLGRLSGGDGAVCVMLILNDVTALVRAKALAEAASSAKGDFLSRMSHEMRTPMNAIIGMATIGLAAEEQERKHYCLNKIAGASRHLLGVINDILDMAKIEADKFELSQAEFSINAMLERIVDVIKFQTDEKKQHFKVEIDKRLPAYLLADEQRLAQVVTNLLSNAVKFTPEGGSISLKAELAGQDSWNCSVRIAVSDTGIGLSEDQRNKLFRPFEQADGSISRKFGGTGLGLAISKRIAEAMGGDIQVESAPGQGSTFTVQVSMLKCQESEASAREHDQAGESAAAEGSFSGKRLLLAEDVEINREIAAALLEHTGVEMDFARDGVEAVNMYLANPGRYDLIFMDLQMPNLDGFGATRRIRESGRPGAADIPIIAMTANVFREDIERCLAVGMNGHLGKPIDADEVVATLAKYLA